ncbi:MAG: DNA primase large subunit [Methanosaeta sp. PtaU1.Bin028]|nr:MAG: DNA primase large subunit [Methanosaeta sp. PtaU1.Bin028]
MRPDLFPFTREAQSLVRLKGHSIDDLISGRGFLPVRRRAVERVRGAIFGQIPEPPEAGYSQEVKDQVELLSYPLARVLVSCLDDESILRRYSLAEAKLCSQRMADCDPPDLLVLAQDLQMDPEIDGDLIWLHFTDYIRSASRFRHPRWKLVNRPLHRGRLTVTTEELRRLLEERVRDRVSQGLPVRMEGICQGLADLLKPLKEDLAARQALDRTDLGEVQEEAFPPCMRAMLDQLAGGVNLAHTARFALTSFLLNINMDVDRVVAVFNNSPDFDEERTRYQVQHICGSSGTRYRPPSCATMATYGNCPGENATCRHVRHPLSYYQRRMREGVPGIQSEEKRTD